VIPSADAVEIAFSFVARRYRRMAICNRPAVERALRLAASLVQDTSTEPAAMFFAFAATRAAFPAAWRLMAGVLAVRQAQMLGYHLEVNREDLDALCLDVLHGRADFPGVVTWFAARKSASR